MAEPLCPTMTWDSPAGYGGQVNGSAGTIGANCPYIEQLSGKNVIRLEGSLASTGFSAVTTLPFFQNINSGSWAQSFTAMGIMREDGAPTDFNCFHCFKPNTGITVLRLMAAGAAFDTLYFTVRTKNNEIINISNGVILNQGWKIVCWQWDHPNKTAKLIVNGTVVSGTNLLMDDFDFLIPVSSYVMATDQDALGAFHYPLSGYMGEFFYYSDVKSNTVINRLGNYLATKYALVWTNI
jgi:hypothetical protein